MVLVVLEELEYCMAKFKALGVYGLLIMLVYLLRCWSLMEIVRASEVLIVNPYVSKRDPHLSLIQGLYLLIDISRVCGFQFAEDGELSPQTTALY